jgi:RNA polymerase sigma-32 factor
MKLPYEDAPPLSTPETSEVRTLLSAYLHEASRHPCMTREEEHETALRVRLDGDRKAGQRMVLANLRLVVKIALEYRNHPGLLDLIQEGNIGLVRAVEKYDPERGTRFSTYATFWIRSYMLKYLMNSWSVVRVGTSDSHRRLVSLLNREKERLERSGITPSPEVLADNLAVSIMEIEDMERRLYHGDVSLEEPRYADGQTLMDIIGSDEDIEDTVIEKDHADMLHERLGDFRKGLNEKERLIFDARLMAEDPLTLEEIGARFNRSRQRVMQMEARILKKLARALKSGQIGPSQSRSVSSEASPCHGRRMGHKHTVRV